ncbi:MAG: urea transporter [Planctomycetota bacterium]|nr:urea transporter [Planctomycetota bacterium]
MDSFPKNTENDSDNAPIYDAFESLFNAYSLIYFCRNSRLGGILLAATFISPTFGLFGLAGTMTAFAATKMLDFPASRIRSGELLCNSLISSMGLAYVTNQQNLSVYLLMILLPVTAIAAMVLSVALTQVMLRLFGMGAYSLPFVIVTIFNYLLMYSFTATPVIGAPPPSLLPEISFLPSILTEWFLAFSAALFIPNVVVGMIACFAVFIHSPLQIALGMFGFLVGYGFLQLTGLNASAFGAGWMGTNYLYCGMGLGGVYFITSKSSLLLAGFGAILSTLIAIGMRTFLRSYNIPPLSFPFLIVLFMFTYALRQRSRFLWLFESPYLDGSPEQNVLRFLTNLKRFPDFYTPTLSLPFLGCRVVTQGFNGDYTHKSLWCHALDFEILDESGKPHPDQRTKLEDAYTYGTAILSPCDGVVISVVSDVIDNELGEENLLQNWGNLVVLLNDLGWYVLLSHFKRDGIIVYKNQRVTRGQLLGYCGNSGRSPLPHLHLQVQAAWFPGATTIPFRIRNFISHHASGETVLTTGIPREGDLISPLQIDPDLIACFSGQIGTSIRYRIEKAGKTIAWETIRTISLGWGEISYRSVEYGARLSASISDETYISHTLENSSASILRLFSLGLGSVPFSKNRSIMWEDFAACRPWISPVNVILSDLLQPISGLPFLHLQSRFLPSNKPDEIIIQTTVITADDRFPTNIEITLSPNLGIIELTASHHGNNWRIVQERAEPFPQANWEK